MPLRKFLKLGSVCVQSANPIRAVERVRLEWERGEQGIGFQDGVVELRQDWGLTVIAPENIESRKVVRVREGALIYHAEAVSVVRVRGGYEIELAFLDRGRRREQRISAAGAARLEASGERDIRANVLNVSASGIGLLCDRALTTGETVRVVGEGIEKLGRVRYCIQVTGGYQIGLHFIEKER